MFLPALIVGYFAIPEAELPASRTGPGEPCNAFRFDLPDIMLRNI